MEEAHRTRYGERAQTFHVPLEHATLPKSSCAHQLEVVEPHPLGF